MPYNRHVDLASSFRDHRLSCSAIRNSLAFPNWPIWIDLRGLLFFLNLFAGSLLYQSACSPVRQFASRSVRQSTSPLVLWFQIGTSKHSPNGRPNGMYRSHLNLLTLRLIHVDTRSCWDSFILRLVHIETCSLWDSSVKSCKLEIAKLEEIPRKSQFSVDWTKSTFQRFIGNRISLEF